MCACSTVILLISLFLPPLHTQTNPHRLSAVCRSTEFVTSINNFVSQRGYRPASCIVDVDWLKVWVRLLVRGRDEQYRDEQYRDEHYRVEQYRDEHYIDEEYRDEQLNSVVIA